MSATYTRLITAARSGLLNIAFNEIIEKIELALLSGDAGACLHRTSSEATALDLVKRLRSEGITSEVVELDGGFHVKVNLSPFFEEVKRDSNASSKNARIRVKFGKNYIKGGHFMTSLRLLKLNPVQGVDYIEFDVDLPDGNVYTFESTAYGMCYETHPVPAAPLMLVATLKLAGLKNVKVIDDRCQFELP